MLFEVEMIQALPWVCAQAEALEVRMKCQAPTHQGKRSKETDPDNTLTVDFQNPDQLL